MVSSITQLLQRTAESLSHKTETEIQHCSGIIFFEPNTDPFRLLEKIAFLRSYCEEIIVGIPSENYDLLSQLKRKEFDFKVRFVEIHHSCLSTMVLEELSRLCVNDRVIFLLSRATTFPSKIIDNLLAIDNPLVGLLNSKGQVIIELFSFKKWNVRFFFQILRLTARTTIKDFFRVMPSKKFLILDEALSLANTAPIGFYSTTETQNLIRMIALLRFLQEEIISNNKISASSSFKIQQLLLIARKTQRDNKFLAFLVPYFLLHYQDYIEELPPTWHLKDIKVFAVEVLKEEIKILENYKLSELIYQCILDLLEQPLLDHNERTTLLKKKELIEKQFAI